jgi:hypothetical protein
MENMSEAIACCSVIYIVGAVLLLLAAACARRDRLGYRAISQP